MAPPHPRDLRFVVVVGKGGVGKTSVSAALGLALARSGRRVLVAMCNARERLSYLLQVPPIGPQIQSIAPRLDAVNMEPGAALREYGLMVLKLRALYSLIFENKLVSAFLRGTPGLDAWAMLGKAQHHVFEQLPDGRPRYDTVIVDAPATGHGLDLLRVPKVILDVVPPGMLRRDAERAWQLFTDPRRSGVLLVTLPEELPVSETLELHAALRDELQLPVCGLVVNMLLPRLFDPAQAAALERLHGRVHDQPQLASPELAPVLASSWTRVQRERMQADALEAPRAGALFRVGTPGRWGAPRRCSSRATSCRRYFRPTSAAPKSSGSRRPGIEDAYRRMLPARAVLT
jgi:anion-transporting  ArsA/GET3 family ATPase